MFKMLAKTVYRATVSVSKMWAMQSIEDSLKKKIENSNTENINWKLTVVNEG